MKELSQNQIILKQTKIRGILRNVDWEDILAGTFTDSYGLFVETLYSALEGNVPERVPRAKKQNVYMNKDSIALKNRKQKLWKKYILSRFRNDYNKFVKCKNDLNFAYMFTLIISLFIHFSMQIIVPK